MVVRFEEMKAKSLMRRFDAVDEWFWTGNSMNLYRGCEHACNYCDGRSHRYHVHEDFDDTVQVKVNAPELLAKELTKLGFPSRKDRAASLADFGGMDLGERKAGPPKFVVSVGGGVSDTYQPAEGKYKLARRCLGVLRDHGMPISILTKSDLVLRDKDIIDDINKQNYASVSFTVTTMDPKVRGRFEPRAPPSEARLKALAELRDLGVHGGVMLMPMIPGIGDAEKSIEAVVSAAKDAKAEFVIYSAMSMRAEQRERVFDLLRDGFPGLIGLYEDVYSKGDWPKDSYMAEVHLRAHSVCRRIGMPERMPRYIPEGAIANNLRVCEVLSNMAFYMQMKDIRFEKVKAYRTAAKDIDKLAVDVKMFSDDGKLTEVPGVGPVIAKDVREILMTGTCNLYEKLME